MTWMQDKNDQWTKNQQQLHKQWNAMKALAFEFLFNAQLGPVNLQ